MFNSTDSKYSHKHMRGLFHLKTHSQKSNYSFSHRRSIHTQMPNVFRKRLYSDILEQTYRIFISTKARRCIIKRGSLDNYLLLTQEKQINSKFGMHLKALIKQKQRDPSFTPLYIPGQSRQRVARKTRHWDYRDVPSIYIPQHVKLYEDQSLFY